MSNFKQVDHNIKTRTPVKTSVTKAQEQWLGDYLHSLQMSEKYNQLIKDMFVCQKCEKPITNPRWVLMIDPQAPNDLSKIQYFHSRGRCNPYLYKICPYCGETFRRKRKTQKFCSKKCAITVMNSPILLRRCLGCGKEFQIRLLRKNQDNESYCPSCR